MKIFGKYQWAEGSSLHLLIVVVAGILLATGTVFAFHSLGLFGGKPPANPPNSEGNENVQVGIDVGNRAPDFTLTDIGGNTFSLSDYRDNVVVVDFMATWCTWCIYEMPDLVKFHKNYSSQGVVMISVDVTTSETKEQLRSFKNKYGADWAFARDTANVAATYQVTGIPTKYIIDQDGIIVWKHSGATSYSTLESEVNNLL